MEGVRLGEAAGKLHYTWDDYRSWDDDARWEILGGEVYAMTPAPAIRHQRVLVTLCSRLEQHFRGRPCDVFAAPTDVRLSDDDVVQPDILVVCDPDRIKPTHIEGAPTLVVEILSPSTAAFDRSRKMALYARSGIKEVWLVTPYPWLVEVFLLDGAGYRLICAYQKEEILSSPTFPDLGITLAEIFDYPIPPEEQVEMVKEGRPPYGSKTD